MLDLTANVAGYGQEVPLLNGERVRYVNLDNAASTPPFKDVVETVDRFLPFYSSVHRGTGFKSRLSTEAYERAHRVVAEFVGADPDRDTVIFGKNTTEAINKLAYRFPLGPDDVVITSQMEHHSNDLPWRHRAKVVHVGVERSGRISEEDLNRRLEQYEGQVKLLAICGASNVTGWVQPIHELAEMAHAIGAKILVDAAQLVPHRRIDMLAHDDPRHLDFIALSAHKMYAPFGTGALIGPKQVFLESPPEYRGGGTVDVVTLDEVEWAGTPDRDEAGSPNVVGAVALARAALTLEAIGLDEVAQHEKELMDYAHSRLAEIGKAILYANHGDGDRVGVIPFNLEGISHFTVAAVLGYEHGVGVRSGCFCAHPYVVQLLDLDEESSSRWRKEILAGNRSDMPGMVRMSFGCYNRFEDIDRLVDGLKRIAAGDLLADYAQDPSTGEFTPNGYEEVVESYFKL
jgi:selenocysteine lyase/cysteine desulfurase